MMKKNLNFSSGNEPAVCPYSGLQRFSHSLFGSGIACHLGCRSISLFILTFALPLITSCSEKKETPNTTPQTQLAQPPDFLVRVNETLLTEEHYRKQAFYFNSLSRLQSNIPEERVQALVESEVLWQETQKLQLAERPHIRRQLQQVLINELLKEKMITDASKPAITEAEARDFYEANSDRYHRPRAVKVAHILITASDEEAARQEAEAILKNPLLQKPGGFSKLVRRYSSDKTTSIRGGDLGFLNLPHDKMGKSDLESWQLELAQAANTLSRIGQVYGKVIETEKGFHIVKLTGRKAPLSYSFAQVKDKIIRQLASEGQAKLYRNYVEKLKAEADIEMNFEALAAILGTGKKEPTLAEKEKAKAAHSLAQTPLPPQQTLEERHVTWIPEEAVNVIGENTAGDVTIKALPPPTSPLPQRSQIEPVARDERFQHSPEGQFITSIKKEVKTESHEKELEVDHE